MPAENCCHHSKASHNKQVDRPGTVFPLKNALIYYGVLKNNMLLSVFSKKILERFIHLNSIINN
jgi:hypothetical protein